MPYADPDPADPMTLNFIGIETNDDAAIREMAACFIEEYARLGFDRERIRQLFRSDGFVGPELALATLGQAAIDRLIDNELAKWGAAGPQRRQRLVQTGAGLGLPVLD